MRNPIKVIVERHADGFVAYPLGLKGVVVGQGGSYDDALADVRSAIEFHRQSFGSDVFEEEDWALEAFVAEISVGS
jgi:predicted RNase H-like HicB family nuclease